MTALTRFLSVLAGLVVLAASSPFAQQPAPAVPGAFDHVRVLGSTLSEFKDDRIQIVTSHYQADRDSRWLLIELGAYSRTKTRIHRDRIELVTPDRRLVAHATPDRVRDAAGLRLRTASSAPRLDWYLPYDGLCCNFASYFRQRGLRVSMAPLDVMPRYGPSFADLVFESPAQAWDAGLYALVVPYDGSEAVLPIELR